jgi:hypothetical protein
MWFNVVDMDARSGAIRKVERPHGPAMVKEPIVRVRVQRVGER